MELINTMLASAASGIVARLVVHPLDTIKARLQVTVDGRVFRNSADALVRTIQSEGIGGLYRGIGVSVLGAAPAVCLYLTAYEQSKRILLDKFGFRDASFVVHFSSGMIAEAASCALWVPIDVTKERLQVQSAESPMAYRNSLDAVKQIISQEGVIGFYRGYGATLMSFGPFSALYFLFYEQFKALALANQSGAYLSFMSALILSASAGSLASFCTNPLDMAKLRLQVQRRAHNSDEALRFGYKNIFDGMIKIFHEGGARALFRGAGARMLFHAPSTAITMSCFEWLKKLLDKRCYG